MIADKARMQSVVQGSTTVSDKIRALHRAGYERADIARFLGKRYQHVRNVLVADEQTKRADSADLVTESAALHDSDAHRGMRSTRVRVGAGGQVALPPSLCEAVGIKEGDVLFARVEDGELRLLTPTAAMRRAQEIVRQFVPEGVSLVDELIADRRREVAREAEGG